MKQLECEACASNSKQPFCTCEKTKCDFCKVHKKCSICGELICQLSENYGKKNKKTFFHLKCEKGVKI